MFFGPPGSGKGTQAKLLAASTGYRHISTGDLLRDLKTKSNLSNDEKIALSHMDRGELVPSYLIYKLAFAEIENALKNTPGVILDGAVRSLEQAREYEKFFEQNGWVVQVQALSINLTDEESFERLTKRRVCSKCGQIYIYNENLNLNYTTVSVLAKKMNNKSTFDNKKYSTNLIGGIYAGYLTSAKISSGNDNHDVSDEFNSLDLGVVLGIEQDRYLTKQIIITPGIRYNQGLLNISNGNNPYDAARTFSFEFNVGIKYIFLKKN